MNIIITGASRGIGLELTSQALAKGHRVLAVARNPEKSDGLRKLKESKLLEVVSADVADPEAGEKIAHSVEGWPSVDVLINNAGIYNDDNTFDDFLKSFRVNSVAPLFVTRALLGKLKQAKQPKAIHITSLMGSISDNQSGGSYSYRASKAALNMINKTLSHDANWLTTIVMHPGWVKTEMGGPNAPTSVQESATGIWRVIDGLKPNVTGEFFDYEGDRLPW